MKKIFKFALCVAIIVGAAACSGGNSKYPATGDMEKDATAIVTEMLKDNADMTKVGEMNASFEEYYKDQGKLNEFKKAIEDATGKLVKEQLDSAFNSGIDEAVDEAVDEALEETTKE